MKTKERLESRAAEAEAEASFALSIHQFGALKGFDYKKDEAAAAIVASARPLRPAGKDYGRLSPHHDSWLAIAAHDYYMRITKHSDCPLHLPFEAPKPVHETWRDVGAVAGGSDLRSFILKTRERLADQVSWKLQTTGPKGSHHISGTPPKKTNTHWNVKPKLTED